MSYSISDLKRYRHDHNPRDVPNEVRNFNTYLQKSPQLATQLQLIVERDGIVRLNDMLIDPSVVILRRLKSILNRLSRENYDKLFAEITRLSKQQSEIVDRVIDVILQNIKLSDCFIRLYAILVRDVESHSLWESSAASFADGLTEKCLQDFETFQSVEVRASLKKRLSDATDCDQKLEIEGRVKRENRAVVQFLGHLFLHDMVCGATVTGIIERLLAPHTDEDSLDEHNIDYLLAIYALVLRKLTAADPETVMATNQRIISLLDQAINMRLKFMIQNFVKQNRLC